MTLHLKCPHCDFIDIVPKECAKTWKCPHCIHENEKKIKGIFLDFFVDSSKKFKGRMDEGKISIREIMDFIDEWTKSRFK
jgi:ribosomal protein L37AE/L43A